MSAGRDLIRALRAVNFVNFRGTVTVEDLASRPWASATFSGERHRLTLCLEGDGAGAAADAFLDGLAEREFDLPGRIVADIALVSDVRDVGVRLTLEALTVDVD